MANNRIEYDEKISGAGFIRPQFREWEGMTDDELRAAFEQIRAEEAKRLGIDPERHIKRGWDALSASKRKREQNVSGRCTTQKH